MLSLLAEFVGQTLCAGIKFMLIEIYVRWPQLKLKQMKFEKKEPAQWKMANFS